MRKKTVQTDVERARRGRNVALGLVLAGFALLFFVMTLVRLGGQAAQ